MALSENEKEWLERRKNLCNRCIKAAWCRTGEKHGYNTERCRFWELKVPNQSILLGSLEEDFRDAAEFEARVALELTDFDASYLPPCPDNCHSRRGCRECQLMYARLAVEAEMEAKQ